MALNDWFDAYSFAVAHNVFALVGIFMSLYVMQLWSRGELAHEHPILIQVRRGALVTLALALLWSLSYAYDKAWEPWPADVLVILAVDAGLGATIASYAIRKRQLAPSVDNRV